jgi:hypothetical protein
VQSSPLRDDRHWINAGLQRRWREGPFESTPQCRCLAWSPHKDDTLEIRQADAGFIKQALDYLHRSLNDRPYQRLVFLALDLDVLYQLSLSVTQHPSDGNLSRRKPRKADFRAFG